MQPLDRLPNEILLSIASHLSPAETLAFSLTKKRHNSIVGESLRWRRHCLKTWRYWHASHDLSSLIEEPPLAVSWRKLCDTRQATDQTAEVIFERLLRTQQRRIRNMEAVAAFGYDVKDLLLRLRDETPDDADDVLARRYHADAILGLIHRTDAIDIWTQLAERDLRVTLEDALGAYDLFVLAGRYGDLRDIHRKLDRLAEEARNFVPSGGGGPWNDLNKKEKALRIAEFLRERKLVGNPDPTRYHDSRNNFLSLALFEPPHTSLPLQSVAIYCAVAQRLDLSAQPSNYPRHVYAVVNDIHEPSEQPGVPQRMYVDPFNSSREIPTTQLTEGLAAMGLLAGQISPFMGPTSIAEIARRTGRNLRYSAQRAWKDTDMLPPHVGYETASYADSWNMALLGDAHAGIRMEPLEAGRNLVAPLLGRVQQHFPQDLCLIERLCESLFPGTSSDESGDEDDDTNQQQQQPLHELDPRESIAELRQADDQPRTPKRRPNNPGPEARFPVEHRVGQFFTHRLYNYLGFIIGWDETCNMPEAWIQHMQVDDLDHGRHQPFYHIIDHHLDARYVAQENIIVMDSKPPSQSMMMYAGRYFKRWDSEAHVLVSNLKEEYPDD